MLSIVLFRSAVYIDLACFHQLPCHGLCHINSVSSVYPECFSRSLVFLLINAMLDGKLFQLFITLLVK